MSSIYDDPAWQALRLIFLDPYESPEAQLEANQEMHRMWVIELDARFCKPVSFPKSPDVQDGHRVRLTYAQQIELPDSGKPEESGWHNFTEDPNMYWVSFLKSWEVTRADWFKYQGAGCLTCKRNDRYFVAE